MDLQAGERGFADGESFLGFQAEERRDEQAKVGLVADQEEGVETVVGAEFVQGVGGVHTAGEEGGGLGRLVESGGDEFGGLDRASVGAREDEVGAEAVALAERGDRAGLFKAMRGERARGVRGGVVLGFGVAEKVESQEREEKG